ncbi:two-component response regulator-like APRR5 isoform X1 [Populus alba]|uniref:Pseudo-response regulator 5b n=1 Tax=Populus alba TaxID=43335 RepID=A0A4U5MQC6_POPAL|nr:two-component response regulator-like APRR5 isoform X1 [Populus alba]TKR71403.1 pseudo-response regulator 5b [Populus alba]
MGEVVVSSGEELEVKTGSETEEEKQSKEETESETGEVKRKRKKKEGEGSNNGLVRWERFLPRMVLRVLLVEADDSTRQIIAALLRKCSYKVATVSDGLKAWEILKERPHNIDLILTEVDLPSVSGYALLTLIMEHEICKNIPVIMMSSQDSIKTVYKCMLRGAADYLVKPIRKNELRNLWQHVWRKQSSLGGGNGPHDESVGQDKTEATSENNAAGNHSSGEMASIQRCKEQAVKRSDSQSSCTKPGLEADGARMENMQEFLQPVWSKFSLTDMNMQKHEEHVNLGQKLLVRDSEAEGSATAVCEDSDKITVDKEITPGSGRMTANIAIEGCDKIGALANSPREAIDFMGASTNHSSFNNVEIHFGSSPHLDLSLRRSHPSGFETQVTEERHTLQHSNASAFTWYTNRASQLPHSALANNGNQEEFRANYDGNISSNVNGYNSDALSLAPSTRRSAISLAAGQTKEYEIVTSSSGEKVFPIHIPVKDTRFNNLCNSYGAVLPPIFCKQSDLSPMMSQSSASQKEPIHKVNPFQCSNYGSTSVQLCDRLGQNANDSIDGSLQKQENKLDSLEGREHISSAADQSASSSFCNGAASHFNSIGYGSASGSYRNADQIATVRAASESKNEEGVFTHNSNSHRSIQREAALTKFRLKRKERCYEKKVRYESRKKLAEQRPRVKGQFVRQVHIDPSPAETDQ